MNFKHSSVEWSSILVFRAEGDFRDPSSVKLFCTTMVPMNIGTTTYTEFETDSGAIKYLIQHDLMDERRGKIHSHNNMNSFHSGTDNEDIIDNCPYFPYYLSVVVNNKFEWDTKIGILGKEKIEKSQIREKFIYSFRDDQSNLYDKPAIIKKVEPMVTERDVVFFYKGEIILEEEVLPPVHFRERDEEISKPKPAPVTYTTYPDYPTYGKKDESLNITKKDPNLVLSPNETLAVLRESLGLAFGAEEGEVTGTLSLIAASDFQKIISEIEASFDKRYCVTGKPYKYPEYVLAFVHRLNNLKSTGGDIMEPLIKRFKTVADIEISALEEEGLLCESLSDGMWKKADTFIPYLKRMTAPSFQKDYILKIRKKFPLLDGDVILKTKFECIEGFDVHWVKTALQNEWSYQDEVITAQFEIRD